MSRLKLGKRQKAIVAGISAVAIASFLLLTFPASMIGNKAEIVSFVSASPPFDETTKIYHIYIENPDYVALANFYATTESTQVDIGETLHRLYATIYVSKTYASTVTQAMTYTRVNTTIKNPAGTPIFSGSLDTHEGLVTDKGTYYEIDYWVGSLNIEVTEGTWTIINKYEVFA